MPTKVYEQVNTETGEIAEFTAKRRMPDNLRRFLIRVQGNKVYLPAAYRIVWFRDELGDEWGIRTQLIEGGHEAGFACVQAEVLNPEGRVIASGLKTESKQDFAAGWVEKAESGAVARALAFLGFGTQFSSDLDDDGYRPADTPNRAAPATTPAAQPTAHSEPQEAAGNGQSDTGHERSRPNGSTADHVEEAARKKGMAWIKGWMKHNEQEPADVGLRRYFCGCALNRDLATCKDMTGAEWEKVKKHYQSMPIEGVLNMVSHYQQQTSVNAGVGEDE